MAKTLDGPYLSSFCLELSLCLKAGVSLSEGVYMLSSDEQSKEKKKMLSAMYEKMDGGMSFSQAVDESGVFPEYVVNMIEIGTKTGRLEAVLKALSEHYDRERRISMSIKNAVVYPIVLLIMLLFVIVVLLTKVLPIFNDVFAQLGASMSPSAVAMMNFGQGLTKYSAVILIVIAAIALIAVIINAVPSLHAKSSAFWGKVNAGHKVNKKIASARFASAMAMTLASGLDTDESMDMVSNITDNSIIRSRIDKIKQDIKDGKTFSDAVSDAEVFSPLYCRMLNVGFKTGTADTVMSEIARRTQIDADEDLDRVINRVEPTLVIIMSLIVGVILLSVMLPLMSIMTTIG